LHALDPTGAVFTTVTLVVVTNEGVVVVDGQGSVPASESLIARIKKVTPQPIKYVVVASDHGDHTGGNAAFKAVYPDVVFIGSPVSQERLAKSTTPLTRVVTDREAVRLGGTEIQLMNLGRAHTGGDLVAYLPDGKVLFMSEVYLRGLFPAMRTAYPTEWLATIDKALAMDVSLYIPGHGFTDDPAAMKRDLIESKKAIEYVIAEAKRLQAAGYTCESAANCPAAQNANWGPYTKWTARTSQAPVALAKAYQEMAGKLP
jgi:glyoxylase-like metal-dependent hydrolase (beta-lactamase superfamily II)